MVRAVAANNGAQLDDIEIGILDLQWIKGPLDQVKTALDGILALGKFQAAAYVGVSVAFAHRQQVRVQIGAWAFCVRMHTRKGDNKPNELAVIKGPDHLSANFFCDYKEMHGDQFDVGKFPNIFLHLDTSVEFLGAFAVSYYDLFNFQRSAHNPNPCHPEGAFYAPEGPRRYFGLKCIVKGTSAQLDFAFPP